MHLHCVHVHAHAVNVFDSSVIFTCAKKYFHSYASANALSFILFRNNILLGIYVNQQCAHMVLVSAKQKFVRRDSQLIGKIP